MLLSVLLLAGSALATPASVYQAITASSSAASSTSAAASSSSSSGSSSSSSGDNSGGSSNNGAISSATESNSTSDNTGLIAQLETAATAVDRLALLNGNSDFLFDFNNPPGANATTMGEGGHTVKSDRKLFPALIGTGVSMTLGFIGPCGFNTPHTHPRSSEINIAVEGTIVAEMVPENGAKIVRNQLSKYQMTVFPQGAMHTEFNPNCDRAVFVAGFASEDPGVQQAVQTFLMFDDDLVQAAVREDFTFSGTDIDKFRSMIPKNVAMGVESCLQKCGIQKSY